MLESIKSVHHTPRGKAIWVNLDPPPSKDYDIWIKGDCQLIPELYEQYERIVEREREEKKEATKRKEEGRIRAGEKRIQEQLRKEENQRIRQLRKQQKESEKLERERKRLERLKLKEHKLAEKTKRQESRPKKKVKVHDSKSALLTPVSYDTDSSLSSPSMSDVEYASIIESDSRDVSVQTPTIRRIIDYLPTPATTPRKPQKALQEQDSPLKHKRKYSHTEDCTTRDSMSIRFIVD